MGEAHGCVGPPRAYYSSVGGTGTGVGRGEGGRELGGGMEAWKIKRGRW